MRLNINKILFYGLMFVMAATSALAATKNTSDEGNKAERKNGALQRTYSGVFDLQKNTVSNFEFYNTNYGIFGFDVANTRGGGFWPRGSVNQYIFAGGVWFAVQKDPPETSTDTTRVKLTSITYNPNSGRGWYVPGRINLGGPERLDNYPDVFEVDENDPLLYRTYFSTDFNQIDGVPIDEEHQHNWPIWDASENVEDTLKQNRYFGYFIPDVDLRNTDNFPKGPAFISGEDIFSTFKDTDLEEYEDGEDIARSKGYPLMLQMEQMIYSWGFGEYRDFVFLKYEITNYSEDTLWNCWLAPVMDVDLGRQPITAFGAGNDRVRFYDEDTTLNLAVQWTNSDRGEFGYGFGYLGFDFLESPAVIQAYDTLEGGDIQLKDSIINNFVRKDKPFYTNEEQLGLRVFRNWNIQEDINEDAARYDFLSQDGVRDGDNGPGDKRFMMSTGPFNMRPHDTVRVVVGIILANAAVSSEADGTEEDMVNLVNRDKFAQQVYDNNFQAPKPPDRTIFGVFTGDPDNPTKTDDYIPYNNAIEIRWDNTAELTIDKNEDGLDFMGYRIYRARRWELDSFDVNVIASGTDADYPNGKGPFGWKFLRQYSINPPFFKNAARGGQDEDDLDMPRIDDFFIAGPWRNPETGEIDSMAISIMKYGLGLRIATEDNVFRSLFDDSTGGARPILYSIDTSRNYAPWSQYYAKILKEDSRVAWTNENVILRPNWQSLSLKDRLLGYDWNSNNNPAIYDSVLVGVARLDRSLIAYNPLYFKEAIEEITTSALDTLIPRYPDGVFGKVEYVPDSTTNPPSVDTVRITTEKIYDYSSVTSGEIDGQVKRLIKVKLPYSINQFMNDEEHLENVKEEIIDLLQRGLIKFDMPDFQESEYVRKNVISPWMEYITDGRRFIDYGDDNRNGWVEENEDPTRSEKLINNVEYFYKIVAFDEGDYNQPTPMKSNEAQPGLPNFVTTRPMAAPVGERINIEVTNVDSNIIGGLYNFQFYTVDQDKLMQHFEGHELELEFNPVWSVFTGDLNPNADLIGERDYGLYMRNVVLRDVTTDDTLFQANLNFAPIPCSNSIRGWFSEHGASYIVEDSLLIDPITGDTIGFNQPLARGYVQRNGLFTTREFNDPLYCYSNPGYWHTRAFNVLGFSFNYTLRQFAGKYRPDTLTFSTYKGSGVTATIPLKYIKHDDWANQADNSKILAARQVDYDHSLGQMVEGSFNNGPGNYEVEFLPGGTEQITVEWGSDDDKIVKTFNVPYLETKVRNLIEYNRPTLENEQDSVVVNYPIEMPHMDIPRVTQKQANIFLGNVDGYSELFSDNRYYPDPRNLPYVGINTNEFIGKYNLHAYGFVNYRGKRFSPVNIKNAYARPNEAPWNDPGLDASVGTQGRYYLTGVSQDGQDTIDFVNLFNMAGTYFASDLLDIKTRSSRTFNELAEPKLPNDYNLWQSTDFKAGDKIYLKTYGGALGFPLPGAKVRARVGVGTPENNNYTETMLDDISVVPNPYFISHQAQKSPYDAKIYFTKLPARATIEIYTINGELVKVIEHDEIVGESRTKASVSVWDLLSNDGTRVQSQTLVAVIKAANGEQTVKKFSVVVGGFRIVE